MALLVKAVKFLKGIPTDINPNTDSLYAKSFVIGGASGTELTKAILDTLTAGATSDAGSLHMHDGRYFRKDQTISVSIGSSNSGLPIKTDSRGKINPSLYEQSDLTHGNLGGLSADDHPQYLNNTRGDARYFQKNEFISSGSGSTDANKPVKTNSSGKIDSSLLESSSFNHEQLSNLNGGAANDHYHLTGEQHGILTGGPLSDSSNLHNHDGRYYNKSQIDSFLGSKANNTDVIKKDGSVAFTQNQSMGGNRLTGLADGISATDAVTKGQLDAAASFSISKDGDAMNGDLHMSGYKITGLGDPVNDADAANKRYVDLVAQGFRNKEAVRVATSSNILPEGLQTVDGIALSEGDRVLVRSQLTASQNGIYIAASGVWARSSDADVSEKMKPGTTVFINEGETLKDLSFTLINDSPIDLNITDLLFTETSRLGQILAGIGLSKTGDTLNVNLGAGVKNLPEDEIGLDLHVSGGLELIDPSTQEASNFTDAQLAIKLDGSTLSRGSTGLKVSDSGIDTDQLKDDSVKTAKIADGNVTTSKLADDSVVTSKIKDQSVTSDKIADQSVTASKINSDVAGSGIVQDTDGSLKINSDDVTIEVDSDVLRIKDSGVSRGKIQNSAIDSTKIDWGTTDTKVSASNVPIVNATNKFNASSVEGALDELAHNSMVSIEASGETIGIGDLVCIRRDSLGEARAYKASAAASDNYINATATIGDLTFTSVNPSGNDIRVKLIKPRINNSALLVSVSGQDVMVSLATNASGSLISTASQIAAAIAASSADELLSVSVSGSGNAIQEAGYAESGSGVIDTSNLPQASSSNDVIYSKPGTYQWTCPEGVTSVSVVCVGGGGAGKSIENPSEESAFGGGGGGLGWKNNILVTPGQTYTVVVGAGGVSSISNNGTSGGDSYFSAPTLVKGDGGLGGGLGSTGGGFVGDGGGNGGSGGNIFSGDDRASGGGGAGGYTGNGGGGGSSGSGGYVDGVYVPNKFQGKYWEIGLGGAGSGGYHQNIKGGSGGGTGLFGKKQGVFVGTIEVQSSSAGGTSISPENSFIKINDAKIDYTFTGGMTLAVINPLDLSVYSINTYAQNGDGTLLTALQNVPNGKIAVIGSFDYASTYYIQDCLIADFGMSPYDKIQDFAYSSSYLFIGVKGGLPNTGVSHHSHWYGLSTVTDDFISRKVTVSYLTDSSINLVGATPSSIIFNEGSGTSSAHGGSGGGNGAYKIPYHEQIATNGGVFGGGGGGATQGYLASSGGNGGVRITWGDTFPQANIAAQASNTVTGDIVFNTVGTHDWVCPAGVKNVSVVCVGGGGGGQLKTSNSGGHGGGGGGLGWKNNIPVTPGQIYTVVVGEGGLESIEAGGVTKVGGGDSYFIDPTVVLGGGGSIYPINAKTGLPLNPQISDMASGRFIGEGGSPGGNGGKALMSYAGGGGGAGGYLPISYTDDGRGGSGANPPRVYPNRGFDTGGGAGGKAETATSPAMSGGGVGLLGKNSGGSSASAGGSGGTAGTATLGGAYGGGGAGQSLSDNSTSAPRGGAGAVRIVWSSTNTAVFPSSLESSTTTGTIYGNSNSNNGSNPNSGPVAEFVNLNGGSDFNDNGRWEVYGMAVNSAVSEGESVKIKKIGRLACSFVTQPTSSMIGRTVYLSTNKGKAIIGEAPSGSLSAIVSLGRLVSLTEIEFRAPTLRGVNG